MVLITLEVGILLMIYGNQNHVFLESDKIVLLMSLLQGYL